LAHTFASPYFGHEPKVRVVTLIICDGKLWLIVGRNFGMFIGLFGSMNDARILRLSNLYQKGKKKFVSIEIKRKSNHI
jgi:hypothetical protein